MELHIPTLALVAVFVTVILGVLLLLAWRRDQSTDALGWWGIGYLFAGASFALLSARGAIADVLSIEIAHTLLLLGYGFLFAGTRAFGGRQTPVTMFLIAPLIWLIAARVPAIANDINLRVVVVSSLQGTFIGLMAYEFWRERAEPLLSRWPAIILMITHIVVLTGRVVTVLVTPILSHGELFRSPVFAVMAFGTVLYTITFAFSAAGDDQGADGAAPQDGVADRSADRAFQPARVPERRRSAHRRASLPQRAARGAARRPRPLQDDQRSLRPCDRRSGPEGVRRAVRRSIGAHDLAGRLGGEEFAVLLPGAREGAAIELAERIRHAFAQAAGEIGGHPIRGTVSIGVAALRIGTHDLLGLLDRADSALYQAKKAGRDRVVAFGDVPEAPLVPAVAPLPLKAAVGGLSTSPVRAGAPFDRGRVSVCQC